MSGIERPPPPSSRAQDLTATMTPKDASERAPVVLHKDRWADAALLFKGQCSVPVGGCPMDVHIGVTTNTDMHATVLNKPEGEEFEGEATAKQIGEQGMPVKLLVDTLKSGMRPASPSSDCLIELKAAEEDGILKLLIIRKINGIELEFKLELKKVPRDPTERLAAKANWQQAELLRLCGKTAELEEKMKQHEQLFSQLRVWAEINGLEKLPTAAPIAAK